MWILLGVLAFVAVGVLIASLVVAERELKEKTRLLEIFESQPVGSIRREQTEIPPDDVERQMTALRTENAQLSAQIDQLKKRETSGGEQRETVEGAEQRLRDAEKQRAQLSEENFRLLASHREFENERARMQSKIQELESFQSRLPQKEERIESLRRENSELQLQVAELRAQRENGEEKIRRLEKELERLPELDRALTDLRQANARFEAQLDNMKSSLRQKIESQLAGLQELHHQLENSSVAEEGRGP